MGALYPRHASGQVCLILKEIQMPPGFICGVVCRDLRTANRTGERRPPLETDLDVKTLGLFGEIYRFNLPRGIDAKGDTDNDSISIL
jgi:hypothetical protein